MIVLFIKITIEDFRIMISRENWREMKNLKSLREAKGLSMHELAEAISCHVSAIHLLEKGINCGRTYYGYEYFAKDLSRVLECDPEDLFKEPSEPKEKGD